MKPINRLISPYNHYDYNNIAYIVIHYVGAQSSTAHNNAVYFNGGDRQASAHYFVDDNEIWQSVEDYHGAWHVGNTRTEVNNTNSIGIEMCCMGPNLQVTEATENNTIELVKYLLNKYGLPISRVRTHYQVSGGTKVCPNWQANNWARWNNFLAKLNGTAVSTPPTTNTSNNPIYRIRKNWNDAASQVGAYRNLESAKAQCPVGYSVYNPSGACVYTNAAAVTTRHYDEYGTFYFNTTVKIRRGVGLSGADTGVCYYAGEHVVYHHVWLGVDGYNWIQYTSTDGTEKYCAVRDLSTGEKFGYAI